MSKFLQTSVFVGDVQTEIIVQPFADRILVLVTQMGKVGNLIQASIPLTTDLRAYASSNVSDLLEHLPPPSPAIQLTTIFGSAPSTHVQTLYSLYATQIATLIWLTLEGESRSVIVGIALQRSSGHAAGELNKEEQEIFHVIMDTLRKMLQGTA